MILNETITIVTMRKTRDLAIISIMILCMAITSTNSSSASLVDSNSNTTGLSSDSSIINPPEVSTQAVFTPGSYPNGLIISNASTINAGLYSVTGDFVIHAGVTATVDGSTLLQIHADNVLIDGTLDCVGAGGSGGLGGPDSGLGQNGDGAGSGGRGSTYGGGGGGAAYGTSGFSGMNGEGNGGFPGNTYDQPNLASGEPFVSNIATGSGGGGGAGGNLAVGGKGGNGGGGVYINVDYNVTIPGQIICDGRDGMDGSNSGVDGSGGGGAGSGGGILIYANNVNLNGGVIYARGGTGGIGGSGQPGFPVYGHDGGNGGNGGAGRIKIYYRQSHQSGAYITGSGSTVVVDHILVPSIELISPLSLAAPGTDVYLNLINTNGSYSYSWDSSGYTTVASNFLPIVPTGDGNHTLSILVYSPDGVFESRTFLIDVDGTAPMISQITPSSIQYKFGSVDNFLEFNVSEANPSYYNVSLNGVTISDHLPYSNQTFAYLIDGLPLGNHTYEFEFVDMTGNVGTITISVVVSDLITPSISSSGGLFDINAPITVLVEGSNGSYSYRWDNGSWIQVADGIDLFTPNLDGVYSLQLLVNSSDGVVVEANYEIIVDGTAPILDTTSLAIEYEEGGSYEISVDVLEPHPDRYVVTLNGFVVINSTYNSGSNNITYQLIGLGTGNHELVISVSDTLGHVTILTFEIIITSATSTSSETSSTISETSGTTTTMESSQNSESSSSTNPINTDISLAPSITILMAILATGVIPLLRRNK